MIVPIVDALRIHIDIVKFYTCIVTVTFVLNTCIVYIFDMVAG